MNRKILTVALIILAACIFAVPPIFGADSKYNPFTKKTDYIGFDRSTVAALPAAATNSGKVYLVTDGNAAGDCTTGTGSTLVLCFSTGSAWAAVGDGTGGAYPGAGIPNSTGSAWGTSYGLDTDLSSVSASDDTIPSAKATKSYADTKLSLAPVSVEVTGTGSLNDAQVSRTIVTNYGMAAGGDTTLPAYTGRTIFTIVVEAASQAWSLKPPSGEAFILDGLALDANDEIDIGQNVGDSATLIRVRTGASTYQWRFEAIRGTHSDGGQS